MTDRDQWLEVRLLKGEIRRNGDIELRLQIDEWQEGWTTHRSIVLTKDDLYSLVRKAVRAKDLEDLEKRAQAFLDL